MLAALLAGSTLNWKTQPRPGNGWLVADRRKAAGEFSPAAELSERLRAGRFIFWH